MLRTGILHSSNDTVLALDPGDLLESAVAVLPMSFPYMWWDRSIAGVAQITGAIYGR